VSELHITSAAKGRARRGRSSASFRLTRWLAVLLIAVGVLVLADGVVTLLWQEPITALIGQIHQDELNGDLARADAAPPTSAERRRLEGIADEQKRIALLARDLQRSTRDGGAVGRIVIPAIGASYVVVNGTDTSDLQEGPGVYSQASFPGTGFPGTGATTAIAGHRTTYLAPFRHIDSLRPGEHIRLAMPYGHFTYTITGHRVISPNDVTAAIANLGYSRLVLSACTPLFSAEKRLLVYARLTEVVPEGAARLSSEGQLPQPIVTPLHPSTRRLPPVLESLDSNHFPASAQ
jgi:sortase A